MPLQLVPPRKGKTPYWYVRGSYLGVTLDRSTKATRKGVAKLVLDRWQEAIERGEYRHREEAPAAPQPVVPTFLSAAVAYMKAGGDPQYLGRILDLTGEYALRDMPLADIDQIALDNACGAIYASATAQTKNRQFYTPVSAVLKRAGIDRPIKRPKGWRGKKSTSWLEPEQAFRLFAEADKLDLEFGLLLRTLCYTGMRISEALGIRLAHVKLDRQEIYLPDTKNGEARSVYIPPGLAEAMVAQPPRAKRGAGLKVVKRGQVGRGPADAGVPFMERAENAKLFRFHQGGHLRDLLKDAMTTAGLEFPRRQGGFHIFCHTYGTWMNRFGGLDTFGLTRTGRWLDPRSADRYRHTAVSSEARMADAFPVRGKDVEKAVSKPRLVGKSR